jgi:hypothetical protein
MGHTANITTPSSRGAVSVGHPRRDRLRVKAFRAAFGSDSGSSWFASVPPNEFGIS